MVLCSCVIDALFVGNGEIWRYTAYTRCVKIVVMGKISNTNCRECLHKIQFCPVFAQFNYNRLINHEK